MSLKESTDEKSRSSENQTPEKFISDGGIVAEGREQHSIEGRDELRTAPDEVFPDGGLRAWLVVLGVRHFPLSFDTLSLNRNFDRVCVIVIRRM